MDNFLAPQQTCHPCDTLASVLAASEVFQSSGRDFLTCLAVAYQVFCRLVWEAPVQEMGFDHTVQLSYGVAAGTSKALGLTLEQTAHALAIAGASAQGLLHKVRTLRDDQFTRRYPDETPCRVVVEFRDGRSVAAEATDWLGFYARPMPAEQVREKYQALAAGHLEQSLQSEICDMVLDFENVAVKDLMDCLAHASPMR